MHMDYEDAITSGIRDLDDVCQFKNLFPNAEHYIAYAKRDFPADGWKLVREWISRVNLYDRYVLWIVMPIEIAPNGTIIALGECELYFIEVQSIDRGRNEEGGPKWKYTFGQFEAGDWNDLVKASGNFTELGADLTVDAPVDRFDTFWRDTRPTADIPEPNSMALRAPLRFQ